MRHFLLALFIILDILLLIVFFKNRTTANLNFPEISTLEAKNMDFAQISAFFKKVASAKGAPYTYKLLKIAPIPPNIDMHLLGHIVGDELYKQQGSAGIKICTEDFRNACSHTIVVGLFSDKGEEALADISKACRNAPGGKGAYTMCFHGLGHGILAYYGYNMEKTVAGCKKTATLENNHRESIECIGGSVMEIIGGGFHDRELWKKQKTKYVKSDDPLSPCNTQIIPSDAKYQCFIYLTPRLFEYAGADLGKPNFNDYKKAINLCLLIAKNDVPSRSGCFGGFGKEFIVLAQGRDIRLSSFANIPDEKLKNISDACSLAEDKDGVKACLLTAVNSLFWGGENDPQTSIRFCQTIPDKDLAKECFTNLIGAVSFYIDNRMYYQDFCLKLPADFSISCQKQLNV